jgi:hypothetical protein
MPQLVSWRFYAEVLNAEPNLITSVGSSVYLKTGIIHRLGPRAHRLGHK